VALALMSWQIFDPRPLQVIVAMSLGQLLGTSSFLSFIYVVAQDLRRSGKAPKGVQNKRGMEDP
jgi:hypothetical protein